MMDIINITFYLVLPLAQLTSHEIMLKRMMSGLDVENDLVKFQLGS